MGKLLSLKKWITVAAAARRLAVVCGDDVSESDVLELALEGKLTLSVRFGGGAYAKPCARISGDALAKLKNGPGGLANVILLDGSQALSVVDRIVQLTSDPYDLPMIGNEKFYVEKVCRSLMGAAPPGLATHNGVLVMSHDGSRHFQLLRVQGERALGREIYYPANMKDAIYYASSTLPVDADLVVRVDALSEFERSIDDATVEDEKPISPTERNTLLVVIAALCKKTGIDHQDRTSASLLARLVDDISVSVSAETIRKALKQIPDAVARRGK